MELFYYFMMLFFLSMVPFIEAAFAVPIAVLAGMPLIPSIIVASIGNVLSVLVIIWLVYWIKKVAKKRKAQSKDSKRTDGAFISKRRRRAEYLRSKYGLPGLAIFGTFIVGSHLTASIACSFTNNRMYVTLWMAISIVIWAVVFGIATYFGVDLISSFI